MNARPVWWAVLLAWVVLACAAPPERRSPEVPAAPAAGAGAARPLSLQEAQRRAAERIEAMQQRRRQEAGEDSPETTEIRARYAALLERPGTPEERKPEILLRLAEFAYRDEETALRGAYESGDEPSVPAGSRYLQSIAYYRRLVAEYPQSSQALTAFYNLGYLYAEQGDAAQSAWAYGEVLARDPGTVYADEIHMRLAEAAFEAADVLGAIPHYQAAIRGGRPEYQDKALYKLGWCFYNLESYDQAVEAFSRVLALGDASADHLRRETLEVMAKAFLEWGGLVRLENYLAERGDGFPYGPRLHQLLGDLYLESSRYREAVAVFAAGVESSPTAPECLGLERGILQGLVVLRDLEGANLRRESWAERYAPGSPWDTANAAGPLVAERDQLLEEGLRVAAVYRHSRAQRGQGDLARAVALYRRYLDLFGAESEAGYEMTFGYAQALKEAGSLDAAAQQYRVVARHPSWSVHREDAGYRRIEVLNELHREQPAVLERVLEAHEDYARLNPDSLLVPEILFAEGELLFEAERFPEARAVFQRVAAQWPDHTLVRAASERIARCRFREQDYPATEVAARHALTLNRDAEAAGRLRKLLAFSIFKQAEILQAAADSEGANREFLRLADEFPEEEAAQIALYRVADNLRAAGRDAEAARVYDRLARDYRGSEYAHSALVLSARLFASLGDWGEAARSYEEIYREDPRGEEAATALFLAANHWERAGKRRAAARLFEEFAATFESDPRVAESHYRRGVVLLALGLPGEARAAFEASWACLPSEQGDLYRARSALALGKLDLDEFQAVRLAGELATALERKERAMEAALERLVQAAALPYADTLTEALFRAGEAFEHMKEALLTSERPPGLSPAEREEYDFLLEERAFPLEERAVGFYRKGVAAARDHRVHTRWVDAMFQRLEVLLPWAYERPEETAFPWELPAPPTAGGAS